MDIARVFDISFNVWDFVNNYCQRNGINGRQAEINKTLMKLMSIKSINLGVTELFKH